MPDPLDPTGVALVTGGTRGLGRHIATRLLEVGVDVAVAGRHEPPEPVTAAGRTAAFLPADVRDPAQAGALVGAVVERFGRLDTLVNGAGGSPAGAAATAPPAQAIDVVTLNLLAPLFVAQAADGVMQGQDTGGAIVNIGSVSGLRAAPGTAAFGAAKAGLVNLTQTLAVELAPRVRVNCVSPAPDAGADDVAEAVLYLASGRAAYVSGANLVLHGGGDRPAYLAALPPT